MCKISISPKIECRKIAENRITPTSYFQVEIKSTPLFTCEKISTHPQKILRCSFLQLQLKVLDSNYNSFFLQCGLQNNLSRNVLEDGQHNCDR